MSEPDFHAEPVPQEPVPPQMPAAEPPRAESYPFWTYMDVLIFAALAMPSLVAGLLVMHGIVAVLPWKPPGRIPDILGQFVGYGILFGLLYVMFRVQYGRPFWESLRWVDIRLPSLAVALAGVLLAFGIGVTSVLLRTPDVNTPMKQLLTNRDTAILLAIFGTTLGPVSEELAFRGFLQPLLVRSFGALPGILLAAVPFGLLHLQQYGFVWQSGVLVTLTGAAFGCLRHTTGSTKAAAMMHAAYNCTLFAGLILQMR